MNEKRFEIPSFKNEEVLLNEEQQNILMNFILTIIQDTKSIYVKCDVNHQDLYDEVVDSMMDLGITNIRESWDIDNPNTWRVKIDLLYPLRYLLDFKKEFDE